MPLTSFIRQNNKGATIQILRDGTNESIANVIINIDNKEYSGKSFVRTAMIHNVDHDIFVAKNKIILVNKNNGLFYELPLYWIK